MNMLKHRRWIYAILAIWVMLFHISDRVDLPNIPILKPLIVQGNIAVEIFLFISGYCVYSSFYKSPDNIKLYFEKRIKRLIIPYVIVCTPFYVWKNLIRFPAENGGFDYLDFLLDLSTYNFWRHGMQTSWFVCAMIVFYMIIPFVYKLNLQFKYSTWIIIIAAYCLNLFSIKYISFYGYSSICWTRLPIFLLGVCAADYVIHKGDLNKLLNSKIVLALSAALIITTFFIWPIRLKTKEFGIRGEWLWLAYGPISVGFLCIINKISSLL